MGPEGYGAARTRLKEERKVERLERALFAGTRKIVCMIKKERNGSVGNPTLI